MKNFYLMVLAFFFGVPLYISAHIAGTYEVKGFDPDANSKYEGILVIQKVNDSVFNALWTFTDGTSDRGTGIRKGKFLSFAFSQNGVPSPLTGTQLYKIERNELEGPWIHLGSTKKGTEKAKRIRD